MYASFNFCENEVKQVFKSRVVKKFVQGKLQSSQTDLIYTRLH